MRTIYEEHIFALNFYKEQIPIMWTSAIKYGKVEPIDFSDEMYFDQLSPHKQVSHALWMAEEMLRIDKREKSNVAIDKVARWLGFIQCVLIMNGLTTIAAERDRTRPWFKKESTDVSET